MAVGDNVVAKWTDGERYPAQIFGVDDKGKFDVYFPQDGEVLRQVNKSSMSRPKKKSQWSKIKRSQFVDLDNFEHDTQRKGVPKKFGKYRPVGIGTGKDINKFVCKSEEKGDDTTYLFDMGYVQQKLLLKCFPLNQKGEKYDSKTIYE